MPLVLLTICFVPQALGCPVCDSPTGEGVRAGIFNQDFWSTLSMVVLPFPIAVLAAWAAIHFSTK